LIEFRRRYFEIAEFLEWEELSNLKDVYLTIPNRPGCGFTLNPEVLDKQMFDETRNNGKPY